MPTPGPLELVIILLIALLVLGPGKLPDVGAALGKSIKRIPQGVVRHPGCRERERGHFPAPG